MIKTMIAAIVSALTAHIITQHRADKKIIALHRSYDRKNDKTFMSAYSQGWKHGEERGYQQGHMHGTIGYHKD